MHCLADEGYYARTYYKGAWAALTDRGVANKNFIVEEVNYGDGDYK